MTDIFASMQQQTEETKKTIVEKDKGVIEEQVSTQNAQKMGNTAAVNAEKKVYYGKIVDNAKNAFTELNEKTKDLQKNARSITDIEANKNYVNVLVRRNKVIELREEQISYFEEAQKNNTPIEEIDNKMKEYDLKIKNAEENYVQSVEEYINKYRNVTPKDVINTLNNEIQKTYERIDNINANLLGMGHRDSHTQEYNREIMKIIETQISMDKKNKEKTVEQIQNEIADKREFIRESVLKCSNAYKMDKITAAEVIKSTYEYDHGYSKELNESINSIITLGIITNIENKETRENLFDQYEDKTQYGSGKNIKRTYFLENLFSHTSTQM